VVETTASAFGAWALAMMTVSRRPVGRGRTLPLVWPRCRPGEVLLHADGSLSQTWSLLIGVGLLLLKAPWCHRWWPPSCRSSSLSEGGNWTVEKALSQHGRMDWQLLSAPLRGCAWNVTWSVPRSRLPCRTSMLGCTPLVLGLNTSTTLIEC
jgi:hypothetical protein